MDPRADLILANRAYLDHQQIDPGPNRPAPSSGGLLAAVRPAIEPWDGGRGTTWIGAGRGPADRAFVDERGFEFIETAHGPLRHRRLFFEDRTWAGHYLSVSNSFLWPLLHLVRPDVIQAALYFPTPVTPSADDWQSYCDVSDAFATAAMEEGERHTAWVHDYQLALVPLALRRKGFPGRIGYFLHTPFPDYATAMAALDAEGARQYTEIVRGILGADLAGFQTTDDARRFIESAVALGLARDAENGVSVDRRHVTVDAYPVGIDPEDISGAAKTTFPPTAVAAVDHFRPLVAGLERSDFTKGISERLRAIAAAYEAGLRFAYAGIAAPTRVGVPLYDGLEDVISREARAASAAANDSPFVHVRESIPWADVVAVQREADVLFTSSIADGMNLVPLQAAVAQRDRAPSERGTIIVGKDSGVARAYAGYDGDGLVPVDPLDHDAMVATLGRAVRGELPRISDRLIAAIERHDARAWADRFLRDLEA